MKILLSLLLIISILILAQNTYAIDIKNRNEYLVDTRGDDGDIYLNRLSTHKKLDKPELDLYFFAESQWNFENDDWEKLIAGFELGKSIGEYLYIGQSLQVISGNMLDLMVFDTNSSSVDTTTKVVLDFPILEQISFRIYEEYSINIEKGRDEYNELGAEVSYSPKEMFSIGFGWRHTDRIHTLDTDYVSLFFTLKL